MVDHLGIRPAWSLQQPFSPHVAFRLKIATLQEVIDWLLLALVVLLVADRSELTREGSKHGDGAKTVASHPQLG